MMVRYDGGQICLWLVRKVSGYSVGSDRSVIGQSGSDKSFIGQ